MGPLGDTILKPDSLGGTMLGSLGETRLEGGSLDDTRLGGDSPDDTRLGGGSSDNIRLWRGSMAGTKLISGSPVSTCGGTRHSPDSLVNTTSKPGLGEIRLRGGSPEDT